MVFGMFNPAVSAISSSAQVQSQLSTGTPPFQLDDFSAMDFPGAKGLPLSVPEFSPGNLLSPEKWLFSVDPKFTVISYHRLINDFL